jgi:hypothetical protein
VPPQIRIWFQNRRPRLSTRTLKGDSKHAGTHAVIKKQRFDTPPSSSIDRATAPSSSSIDCPHVVNCFASPALSAHSQVPNAPEPEEVGPMRASPSFQALFLEPSLFDDGASFSQYAHALDGEPLNAWDMATINIGDVLDMLDGINV